MGGYSKLWNCIITSSIWNENDKTRIVWITLLALKEDDGIARCSVGSLAHMARVDLEGTKKAIEVLSSPDEDSRSAEFDGRRIEKVDGGFLILNHEKHRNSNNDFDRREYMREYMKRKRKEAKEKENFNTDTDTAVSSCKTNVKLVNFNNSLPFNSKVFEETWNEWISHRREIKKPLTPTASKKQLSFLSSKAEKEAIEIIEMSIRNGWQGLFESKNFNKNEKFKPKQKVKIV